MLGYYKPYYILSCFQCCYDIFLNTKCRPGKIIPYFKWMICRIDKFYHSILFSDNPYYSKSYVTLIPMKATLNNWANCTLLIAVNVYNNIIRILSIAATGYKSLFIITVRVAGRFSLMLNRLCIAVNESCKGYMKVENVVSAYKRLLLLAVRYGGEFSHKVYSLLSSENDCNDKTILAVRIGGEFSHQAYRLSDGGNEYRLQVLQLQDSGIASHIHSNDCIYQLNEYRLQVLQLQDMGIASHFHFNNCIYQLNEYKLQVLQLQDSGIASHIHSNNYIDQLNACCLRDACLWVKDFFSRMNYTIFSIINNVL